MGNIVLLDELTINQIAAGEVVERPANVVKELVENSIDAGATKISIEIRNGGISYIRITDNGKGFMQDDLEIAFERHATSKIRSSDDLLKVMTMGFRGEALASIASIARVELISCYENSDIGNKIIVEGGNILEKEEFGCPKGTTITVENLFYNTPVRYKFLKRDFTEAGYIEDIVTRIALVNPHISFKLINSGKEIINTTGNGDLKSAVHSIYGKDVSMFLIPVDYEYEKIKVQGVIGKAEIARSNRNNQITYINGRHVKNKTMSAAIDEAYKTVIPHGKFAFTVLNLKIAPETVDVNVHPAKLEVRFQNEGDVFKAIYHAVKSALLGNDLSRIIDDSTEKQEIVKKEVVANPKEQINKMKEMFGKLNEQIDEITVEKQKVQEIVSDMYNIHTETKINGVNEDKAKYIAIVNNILEDDIKEEVTATNVSEGNEIKENNDTAKIIENDIVKQEEVQTEQNSLFREDEEKKEKQYKYIGTVFNTYIIIEYLGEMYIIDQHAAHERVMYEQVKQNYYSDKVLSQMLLIPEVVTVTNFEKDIVNNNLEMFNKAGYEIEDFGDNTFKIVGVPYVCIDINVKELFLDILDGLKGYTSTVSEEKEEKFISTIACKAAVKANMNLKIEEVENLLNEMLKLENPFSCPHGRPTAIKMSKYEIERKFGRK
ncbi:MAG: DNA mismatch repair endonuclease MutL [Clostridiales bacterium]|nr:DNA mismatch repair endonuclease MutL [Clostridiales bacterium]